MSYEYKEIIKSRVYEPNASPLYWEAQNRGVGAHIVIRDALKELDHVYAQAAKADEYEAKAKLMDNIYAELKKRDGEAIDSLNVDYYDFGVYVARTIEEYESECDSND